MIQHNLIHQLFLPIIYFILLLLILINNFNFLDFHLNFYQEKKLVVYNLICLIIIIFKEHLLKFKVYSFHLLLIYFLLSFIQLIFSFIQFNLKQQKHLL